MSTDLPKLSTLQHQCADIRRVMKELDKHRLEDLLRRAGISPRPLEEGPGPDVVDGFSRGPGAHNPGVVARPTESTVLSLAGGRINDDESETPDTWLPQFDPIGTIVSEAFDQLDIAAHAIRKAERKIAAVIYADAGAKERKTSLAGDCGACGRTVLGTPTDKLKAGYDGACYQAWLRAGFPDRQEFERDRRRKLKERAS